MLPGASLERVRRQLGQEDRCSLQDMTAVGRNPARILSLLCDWVDRHPGPVRLVAESTWSGRSQAESAEAMRHEALVNLALADADASLLCPYGSEALSPDQLADAERSHRRIAKPDGSIDDSVRYGDPMSTVTQPLEVPVAPVEELPITEDLRRVRECVAASRAIAPLSSPQREDFVLAINEAATNALKYDRPPRAVRLWRSGASVIGEVVASGEIKDPLAGRRRPRPAALSGRGLWIVNQLCDLVELRSAGSKTTLRIHMQYG
jgi:anti-sigma regulatory factor (Ser/Thr protein kinase)